MKRLYFLPTMIVLLAGLLSCNNQQGNTNQQSDSSSQKTNNTAAPLQNDASVKEEAISYSAGNVNMKGYVAYDEKTGGKRPIVLIAPEWWGLTDYPRMRAKELAQMGYFAVAMDMYGDGKIADNPDAANKAATPFYTNPQMGKERMDAALEKAKTFAQADASKVFAIGYCFGGTMVLNYAKLNAPVLGVVSFHGILQGPSPQKGTKPQFLICHGDKDDFVPQSQVNAFKKSMDSAGVAYSFKVYEGAQHAFTNPKATEMGQKFNLPVSYNAKADSASWSDMKDFFGKLLK